MVKFNRHDLVYRLLRLTAEYDKVRGVRDYLMKRHNASLDIPEGEDLTIFDPRLMVPYPPEFEAARDECDKAKQALQAFEDEIDGIYRAHADEGEQAQIQMGSTW